MDPASLFTGRLVRLTAFEPEKDAETLSRWTHDPDYLGGLNSDLTRPLSATQAKKRLEEQEKEAREKRSLFSFALRPLEDDRLIGQAFIHRVDWTQGAADFRLGLGAPEDRRQGRGADTLRLLLRYAFGEMNLHRLAGSLGSDNLAGVRLLESCGFQLEVRRREALWRAGQRVDELWYGILHTEWRP